MILNSVWIKGKEYDLTCISGDTQLSLIGLQDLPLDKEVIERVKSLEAYSIKIMSKDSVLIVDMEREISSPHIKKANMAKFKAGGALVVPRNAALQYLDAATVRMNAMKATNQWATSSAMKEKKMVQKYEANGKGTSKDRAFYASTLKSKAKGKANKNHDEINNDSDDDELGSGQEDPLIASAAPSSALPSSATGLRSLFIEDDDDYSELPLTSAAASYAHLLLAPREGESSSNPSGFSRPRNDDSESDPISASAADSSQRRLLMTAPFRRHPAHNEAQAAPAAAPNPLEADDDDDIVVKRRRTTKSSAVESSKFGMIDLTNE